MIYYVLCSELYTAVVALKCMNAEELNYIIGGVEFNNKNNRKRKRGIFQVGK